MCRFDGVGGDKRRVWGECRCTGGRGDLRNGDLRNLRYVGGVQYLRVQSGRVGGVNGKNPGGCGGCEVAAGLQ